MGGGDNVPTLSSPYKFRFRVIFSAAVPGGRQGLNYSSGSWGTILFPTVMQEVAELPHETVHVPFIVMVGPQGALEEEVPLGRSVCSWTISSYMSHLLLLTLLWASPLVLPHHLCLLVWFLYRPSGLCFLG